LAYGAHERMKKVLVVDDSQTILKSLKYEFDKHENIEAIYAKSYKEAEKVLADDTQKIYAALLDINLPDAPNGEVISLANSYNVPAVVLTGTLSKEVRKTIQQKDIIAYILKDNMSSAKLAIKFIQRVLKNYDTTVMIVDDSVVYRKALSQSLKKINIKVLEASDGLEAITMIKKTKAKISIVVTDYEMPHMNGLELTIKIRETYNKDQMGIIAISSADDKDIIADFLKFGANDFLNKPFSPYEVVMRINSNLELLDIFQDFSDLANRDYLTNSYNRRYFFDRGIRLFLKSKINSNPLTIAMLDIDNFKKINDTFGHDIGDIAIKNIKKILDKYLDEKDLAARFGGEEYCILIENKNINEVKILFETIRIAFEHNVIKTKNVEIKYTVSIGIAHGMHDDLDDMVKLSDDALYIAKESGRNQVVIKTAE